MKEVIQQMLKVEAEAKRRLYQAEQQAAEVLEKARRRANDQAEAVRAQAQEDASRRVQDAQQTMQSERDKKLRVVDAGNAAYAETIRPNIPEAVDRLVKRVIGD
jgi:F0F1-type ATP synthase membrane subunit b/b'